MLVCVNCPADQTTSTQGSDQTSSFFLAFDTPVPEDDTRHGCPGRWAAYQRNRLQAVGSLTASLWHMSGQ
jgi:hypothetical protein